MDDITFPFVHEPPSIYGSYVDTVVFSYKKKKTSYGKESENRISDICYRNIMYDLVKSDIVCHPRDDQVLPFENTQELFGIFKEDKVLAHGFKLKNVSGKAELEIPVNSHNTKDKVYLTLCLFRFCDSNPKMIYEFLCRVKEFPDINHWQVFHYVSSIYCHNYGHNFINVAKCNWSYVGLSAESKKRFVKGSVVSSSYYEPIKKKEDILKPEYKKYY